MTWLEREFQTDKGDPKSVLVGILVKLYFRVKDFNTILLGIKDFDTIIKIPIPFDRSNDFKDIFSLMRPFISA